MDIQSVKQRFGIIGNDPKLNLAIEKAIRIAPTDVSVLITGESGVGKESYIPYRAVNMANISPSTVELFPRVL